MTPSAVLPLSDDYRRPIQFALFQQIPPAVLCLLLLDGGGAAKFCGIMILGFWAGGALIMWRRPLAPTILDKLLIQFSFLPLFAAAALVVRLIQR